MRMIGLIGGMSWESSAAYYRILNQGVRDRVGPTASARCLLWSFDFAEIEALQHAGDWDGLAERMVEAARRLEAAGADVLLICTNTMHKLADAVQDAIKVPLLNIIDITAEALKKAGAKRPLLLATRYTMEQDFYVERMRREHGLDPIVPEAADRDDVHRIIFSELCCGVVLDESRARYMDVIARGRAAGADSVILGCTEIGLLIKPEDLDLPAFDSTLLHADAEIEFALRQQGGKQAA